MYISKFIVIGKENNYQKIYVPKYNSIVLVSAKMYITLCNLAMKYNGSEIDVTNKDFKDIKETPEYNILVKNNVFVENLNGLEERYRLFVPSLSSVYFHVSQECNLRCTYCYARHNLGKNMIMSVQNANRFINQLYEKGVRNYIITGGEPMLNPSLEAIIDIINSKKDVRIELLSNGTILDGKISILEKLDNYIVSLDVGDSKQRRGISADKVLANLTKLPESIKNKTTVRSVISRGEELLVPEMRKKIESLGLKYISIPRLPNCANDLMEFPDVSLLEAPMELVDTLAMIRCGAATSIVAVDWNGDVYPCQNLMRTEHLITNMNSDLWYENLLNSTMRTIMCKAHVLNIDKCKECVVRFVCGGGCRALSYNVYQNYYHHLEFYCNHFKKYALDKLNKIAFKYNKKA